jgi:hypothetical protein
LEAWNDLMWPLRHRRQGIVVNRRDRKHRQVTG